MLFVFFHFRFSTKLSLLYLLNMHISFIPYPYLKFSVCVWIGLQIHLKKNMNWKYLIITNKIWNPFNHLLLIFRYKKTRTISQTIFLGLLKKKTTRLTKTNTHTSSWQFGSQSLGKRIRKNGLKTKKIALCQSNGKIVIREQLVDYIFFYF